MGQIADVFTSNDPQYGEDEVTDGRGCIPRPHYIHMPIQTKIQVWRLMSHQCVADDREAANPSPAEKKVAKIPSKVDMYFLHPKIIVILVSW